MDWNGFPQDPVPASCFRSGLHPAIDGKTEARFSFASNISVLRALNK